VLAPAAAVDLAAAWRGAGLRVVFTRGVFDLLHPGHVRFLRTARALGDVLIAGVDGDAAIHRDEGHPPVNPEHERAEVLAALASVDAVVIVADDTPEGIIAKLQPDVLVCGARSPARPAGSATVEGRGGRLVHLPAVPGYSSAALASKVRAL
jgi:rfaE bifunctional protein nucleotidyltransferase chain/domain